MASKVAICNMALAHLGENALVTSIDPPDGSAEAGYCKTFYDQARLELLEDHAWTFARTRAALSAVTNPSPTWAYAYALPSTCKTPTKVLQQSYLSQILFWPYSEVYTADQIQVMTEAPGADFALEGNVILTNEPDAVLLFETDTTDTTKFSAKFTTALSYLLASYLAGPLVKGDVGAKTGAQLRAAAATVAGEAKTHDANKGSESSTHVPDHLRVR